MYNALKKLGYKSYHMSEACMSAGKGHLIMWNEAIRAKYGPSPNVNSDGESSTLLAPYSSSDFGKLFQDYDALSDIPSVLFIPELLAAYPHARLILTTHPRGVDGWLRSMHNSYFRISGWSVWSRLMMPYDTLFSRPYMTLVRRVVEIWTGTPWPAASDFAAVEPRLRTFYAEHNDEMRRLARDQGRVLLEFDPNKGWEPLAEFLGKEIPSEPYPHANGGNSVVNLHKLLILMRLQAVFGPSIAKVVGGLAVVGLAWWWMRR